MVDKQQPPGGQPGAGQPGDDQSDDGLAFTVATVWREERVSCPHPQVLQAFLSDALPSGAKEFLDFHLTESQCPFCNSVVDEMRESERQAANTRLESLKERLLRSTAAELRRISDSR